MKKLPLVVAHDAGASELISSYIKKSGMQARYALRGPAINIFKKRLGEVEISTIEGALIHSDYLLTGTGWSSFFEISAIKLAKERGVKVVAFLDHWANYLERFYWMGDYILPNEIWVSDLEAKYIANATFPNIKIRVKQNYYFQEVINEFREVQTKISECNQVLFVSQAIAEMNNNFASNGANFNQYDSLNFLIKNLSCFEDISKVVIRPHPSEDFDIKKINLNLLKIPIEVDCKISLIEQIARSKIIFGVNSTALVLAVKMGKRTVSCILDGLTIFELPHKDIEKLSMLIDYSNK